MFDRVLNTPLSYSEIFDISRHSTGPFLTHFSIQKGLNLHFPKKLQKNQNSHIHEEPCRAASEHIREISADILV